ncbi:MULTISPECIES: hypothetical protein [unclassified Microcoleus]|nr:MULTISPECIES: hypothetical protein [unclassified Microcoleus]
MKPEQFVELAQNLIRSLLNCPREFGDCDRIYTNEVPATRD